MGAPELSTGAPLRILFSMRNFWYVRIFESVVRDLARRGHVVHICAERGEGKVVARDWNDAAAALAREHTNVTFEWAPRDTGDRWAPLRLSVNFGLDYLRFFGSEYANAPVLGARARERTSPFLVALANAPVVRTRAGRRVLAGVLRLIERALPLDAELAAYIEKQRADVVLLTPLLTLGSEQHDVLRTARRLGIPSVLCVGSWDHLSSKALLREVPDRVIVWNETQKEEARKFHHIAPSVVTVTGAQCFDHWFGRRPTLDRESFCRKVGLDPSKPYVLYVCSALFEGSPSEAEFVVTWAHALRACGDAGMAAAGILVRPHPKRGFEWDDVNLSQITGTSLWPPSAAAPFQAEAKADYFDSLFHSAAVVGLNTSALIEAGIVGRAVHTLLLPEFQQNQEGTLHFHYLLEGGLLRSARDLPSHVDQLAQSVRTADPDVHHNRAFVEHFVRPLGFDVPATPVFTNAVEEIAASVTRAHPAPWWSPVLRLVLSPLTGIVEGSFDKIERDRRRREKARERQAEREARVAQRAARRQAAQNERDTQVLKARHAKQQLKQQKDDVKRQARDAQQSEKRRRQQRQLFNARVAAYYRRLIRPFSAHR